LNGLAHLLLLSKITKVKYPAAASGPEGLWPGGSCGALKFKTYFHAVIPAEAGIQSFQAFLDSRFRGSDSDLGFLSNPLNHFAFGDPVFIRPAELSGIQQGFL
jgi:hypothetical protein